MRHRGPDGEGFFIAGAIGLANRRLSIIDLESGKQPISNENRTIWIVFNGEIYNYRDLRIELIEHGHHFATRSDTEVIVHLYEEYGLDCVKHLQGMFAFALWDANLERLVLARDPLGQKPLYYTYRQGRFTFASEMKALFQATPTTPRLNVWALHNYMSLRCVPSTDTLFEGVSKLPAGHTLIFERGVITTSPYWTLTYTPKASGSFKDACGQLRDLLLATIESHMVSDVPVGAFLSGGLDSSLVVAMMATLSDTPIRTFSIGAREQDFNELPFARLVAERYGTDHHELIVKPDLIGTLPEMLWHMEEPVDPFAFGIYNAARLAGQHVKVVLGGDGGDELFAGYDRYLGNRLVDLYCLIPEGLRRTLIEPLIQRLPDTYKYNNRVQKLRWLVAMSETGAGERYARSASFLRFSHAHKKALYSKELWQELGAHDSSAYLLALFNADNATDTIDKMLYTDVKTRLPDHLLMIGDRMTMAHSVEGRSPYVDQRVVEFVATLPAHFKLRGRTLKHIQREVAREFLPETVVRRQKQGFSFPIAYWFKKELRPLASHLFHNSRLAQEGYFRRETMLALLDEHANGRGDHNYRLWLLLALELWYRLFIEGASIEKLKYLVGSSFQQPFPALNGTREL